MNTASRVGRYYVYYVLRLTQWLFCFNHINIKSEQMILILFALWELSFCPETKDELWREFWMAYDYL